MQRPAKKIWDETLEFQDRLAGGAASSYSFA
jgi:hypothetical protein